MVLHVFISLLGGVPLCIPYGLYSGTSLGGTTRGTLEVYPGRVLSMTGGSGGRDLAWMYFTSLEGNKNRTICNYCGLMIKKMVKLLA